MVCARDSKDPRGARGVDGGLPAPEQVPDAHETLVLARLAKDGDRRALNDLLGRHEEWLRRVIRIKLSGTSGRARRYFDTVDVAQEAFGVVAQKISELEVRSPGEVRQWLAKIAAYKLQDCLKYHDAEARDPAREVPLHGGSATAGDGTPALEVPSNETEASERAWRRELKDVLDEAVSRLPEHYQDVVLLRDYSKETWEEIRDQLGLPSVGAAKQRYQRAWIKIRQYAAPRLT